MINSQLSIERKESYMKIGLTILCGVAIAVLTVCAASGRMFVVAADANAVSVEFRSNMQFRLVGQTMTQSPADPNQLIITTKLQITGGGNL